ncbi:MAG TPA: Uma2 family endonuclease [Chthoniobacteraceae bacterium]|nr:Uma2 family endonuclease [Chthoniobacteraceae bacterium]
MIGVQLRRFTSKEYIAMAAHGILHRDRDARVELLNGQVVDHMRAGPMHEGVRSWLTEKFVLIDVDRWTTFARSPIDLDEYSLPEPDVSIVRRREDFYCKAYPTAADVLLLIEVADLSLLYDREEKLPAYARVGIPEVWIVNLVRRVIEIFVDPAQGKYAGSEQVEFGGTVRSRALADVEIDTAEFFDRV